MKAGRGGMGAWSRLELRRRRAAFGVRSKGEGQKYVPRSEMIYTRLCAGGEYNWTILTVYPRCRSTNCLGLRTVAPAWPDTR